MKVILCDHHGWGGIPACQEMGRLCATMGWKLSQHSDNHAGTIMAGMIHLGAVVPQLTLAFDTHYPWLIEGADIIQGGNLPIRRKTRKETQQEASATVVLRAGSFSNGIGWSRFRR